MERSTRLGVASATLVVVGLMAGVLTTMSAPLSDVGLAITDGTASTGVLSGVCLAFIGCSLAMGVGNPRPKGSRHARTTKRQRHRIAHQSRVGAQVDGQRWWEEALPIALPEPVQVLSDPEQQHIQSGVDHPSPHLSDQSHLLGGHKMSTIPSPRQPVVASLEGWGRRSPHGFIELPLILQMCYQPNRPYEVTIGIAPKHQPSRPDATGWLVSREVLCNAAIWETPAGMGDFRAAPMGSETTQLTFISTELDHIGENMYVDVVRRCLVEFLGRTMHAVKLGHESKCLDMSDEALAMFVAGDLR